MVKPSVFVTRRWPVAVEAKLAEDYEVVLNTGDKPLTPAEFRETLGKFDAVLPTVTDRLTAEALDVSRLKKSVQTRILGNYGDGYSHICEASVRELGLTVTNTPEGPAECTADLAMALLLMVARRTGEGEREARSGSWSGWRPTHLIGSRVSGKTSGIIGFGSTGQETARRAHHGFGMKVVVYNSLPIAPETLARDSATQVDTIEDLMPLCDFVSLHCQGGQENRHLINSRRLNLMKPDAFLINTARSDVIDEQALAHALMFDTIGGAALDVFEGEPRINSTLIQCDKLVILPNMSSATKETREAIGFRVLDNLNDFFAGRDPRDRVI